MLSVKNLKVSVKKEPDSPQIPILKGVDLVVAKNEVCALMGKNGSGKSTLAQALMGSPFYEVTDGEVVFDGKDLLKLDTSERSQAGLFLSFQHPNEIEGVTIASYLRLVYHKHHSAKLTPMKFREFIKGKLNILGIDESFLDRYLNEGFSGGEKKRMEMLQMLIIEPKFIILDEVDSGLDVDAIKVVAEAVNYLKKQKEIGILLITHYSRILKYIEPDKVVVLSDGKVVKEGNKDLAFKIEEEGFLDEPVEAVTF
jgi:Fe-S cluster assembly ATP-binding protein